MYHSYRSLLNDFAFKYVFGADTKESNEALKGLLEVYLNLKIKQLEIKNPEMTKNIEKMKSGRFDILAELDNQIQVDIEMQVVVDQEELFNRMLYYGARIYSSQDMKGKLYSDAKQSIVLIFVNGKLFETPAFCQSTAVYTEFGVFISDAIKLVIVELGKIDGSKPTKDMNAQERLAYYFLNCQDRLNNSKIKELIEGDKVVQMVDKQVDQIEEDRWKKLDQDFAEFHENERQMRIKKWEQKQAEELEKKLQKKFQEELQEKTQKSLQQGINQGIEQGRQETMISILSKTMSADQIALVLEISEEQVKAYLSE